MMRMLTDPARVALNGQACELRQSCHSMVQVHIRQRRTPVHLQHLQLMQAPLLRVASIGELLGPGLQSATYFQV